MSDKTGNTKPINLSPHAKEKLKRLVQSGITEEKAIKTIRNPESLILGYFDRKIAQSSPLQMSFCSELSMKKLIITSW